MTIKYNMQVVTGKYTKDGKEKNRYQTIGKVMETKYGLQFKLDSMPICDAHWNGFGYLNLPYEEEQTEDVKF
jgi:hypothetical protein